MAYTGPPYVGRRAQRAPGHSRLSIQNGKDPPFKAFKVLDNIYSVLKFCTHQFTLLLVVGAHRV